MSANRLLELLINEVLREDLAMKPSTLDQFLVIHRAA